MANRCEGLLTWRGIDDEVIELAPPHLAQELLDHSILLRAPPHDALPRIGQEEAYAHAREHPAADLALLLAEDLGAAVQVDGHPAALALVHVLAVKSEHPGERRTGQVDVEQANAGLGVAGQERERELDGDGRLADPALAREDEEDVLDLAQAREQMRL